MRPPSYSFFSSRFGTSIVHLLPVLRIFLIEVTIIDFFFCRWIFDVHYKIVLSLIQFALQNYKIYNPFLSFNSWSPKKLETFEKNALSNKFEWEVEKKELISTLWKKKSFLHFLTYPQQERKGKETKRNRRKEESSLDPFNSSSKIKI